MDYSLRIAIFLVALLIFFVIAFLLRKGRIPVKFSLLWLIVVISLSLVAIIPDFLLIFMNILGFQTLSNMLIGVLFLVLFFITVSLTVIVSGQKTKIQLLIQELSLLKREVHESDNEDGK